MKYISSILKKANTLEIPLAIIILVSLVLTFTSCSFKNNNEKLIASQDEAHRWAQKKLKSLTLEKRIGQMICEQMRGEYMADDDPRLKYLLTLIKEYGVGGFVIYGGTPYDTAHLLNRLQAESELPLLISADFEGGPGQQISGATEFPANMALAAISSEDLAYQVGKVGAIEGRAIGIHLTYSPVVDIQTNPNNPVLGVRSFGLDLELLQRLASAYIRGYQENGMLATAKHYPGRGDVELIPGTEFTINLKPAEKIKDEDLWAFKIAIDAGVAFIMTEHIAVPSLTSGSDLPASVNKTLIIEWLRNRLGFKGVITTDDMWYEKVVKRFGSVRACVMAIQAGHDVILKPADAIETIKGLIEAVRKGEIKEEQIDQSVYKILFWKAKLNLHRNRFVDEKLISSKVGIQEHKKLAQEIADRSITLIKNDNFFPPDLSQVKKILHLSLQRKENDQAPMLVAAKLKEAFPGLETFFLGTNSSDQYYERAMQAAGSADLIIISLFVPRTVYKDNGLLTEKEMTFFDKIVNMKPKATIVMSYGNPYHAARFNRATAFLVGYGEGGFYGNQIIYADSFIKLLKKEISPQGRLPVTISQDYPYGTGIRY